MPIAHPFRLVSSVAVLILLLSSTLFAEPPKNGNRTQVSVTSTTVAVQLFTSILTSARVQIPSDAATSIFICEINTSETCASVVNKNGCFELLPLQIYTYAPGEYGGGGCALLKTGSTAVSASVSTK